MRSVGERSGVVSWADGGALASAAGLDLRPWRIPTLLVGAALACIATLALATSPAPTVPSIHQLASRDHAQSRAATRLPIGLAPAASASIGASDHSFWPVRRGASLLTRGGGIDSAFTASGARLRVAQGTVTLSLASVARGQRTELVSAAAPSAAASQILYRHGSLSELYRNGPYGLEQGFTLRQAPSGSIGSVVLALRVSGSLTPEQAGSQILFRTPAGATALAYGQLSAVDATGRHLPARMEIRSGVLRLRIDDRNARYPLRIDPFFQQGSKLTGGEESGKGQFGQNVALSADGNTALIGGPNDNGEVGAAWVFTRSEGVWTQQGKKLTGGEEVGSGRFGYGVALSGDGNTALIGGGSDNGGVGAAWVFTRSESTWTQQGEKLTGSGETGTAHFGFRVALSAEGNTALIGGPEDNLKAGAAWVFTQAESKWTQQGPKLTGGEESGKGEFGEGVALSANGSTALVGGGGDNGEVGAAWVFTHSEAGWEQQGPKLVGGGESGKGKFGYRVALSEKGDTALIGGGSDNESIGAAWVFTQAESKWTQQGEKLTGGGESGKGHFGFSVALSASGNNALIGASGDNGEAGAAWVFTRSGSIWEQLVKLTGGGESGTGLFGDGVALSGDGNTALIGGPGDGAKAGAAWVFVNVEPKAPTVVTGSASAVTQSAATLNATVNPNGETVSDCHFEYGTSTEYGSTVPCTSLPGSGGTPVAVSAPITGLKEGASYHFRIIATNASGTSEGADQGLTTEEAPEYGRCLLVTPTKEGKKIVYHGGFTAATCLLRSETKTGKYEWYRGVVKAGFTTTIKEGVATFETVKKVKVTCKTENGKGAYSGAREVANVTLKLTGCESGGQKCTTPGLVEGELETKTLEGKLGWEVKAMKKVALDLFPVGNTGPVLEYTCTGGVPLTVGGSILAPVVVDKMAATSTLKYKATAGKQKPEQFEGALKDVLSVTPNGETFEQLGEAVTLTEASEEALEINAVV